MHKFVNINSQDKCTNRYTYVCTPALMYTRRPYRYFRQLISAVLESSNVRTKQTNLGPCSPSVRVVCTWGTRIPGAKKPNRLNGVRWRLKSVGPQHETCFMSPFWSLELWGGPKIFGKFAHYTYIPIQLHFIMYISLKSIAYNWSYELRS
jgi:hypothetical protein